MSCIPQIVSEPDVEFKPFSGNMVQSAWVSIMLNHVTQWKGNSINTAYSTARMKHSLLLDQLDSEGQFPFG